MGLGIGQVVVNGRKVRGRMVKCVDTEAKMRDCLSEDGCLFSVNGSVFMKLFDLVKYGRLTYGLNLTEMRLLFLLSTARRGWLNKSYFILFSGLNDKLCVNTIASLVELGYLVEFDGQKFRSKKRGVSYSLSSSGLAVLEDCFRYWDDVLKFRSM